MPGNAVSSTSSSISGKVIFSSKSSSIPGNDTSSISSSSTVGKDISSSKSNISSFPKSVLFGATVAFGVTISSISSNPGSKASSNSVFSSTIGLVTCTLSTFAVVCLLTCAGCCMLVGFAVTVGLAVTCGVLFTATPSCVLVVLTTGLCAGGVCGSTFSGTAVGAFLTIGLAVCLAFLTAEGITIGLVIFPA